MTRVDWFRLILGVILGLIFGLYYAWFVSPRQIHQSRPSDLSPDFQAEYLTLIASSFANTGNLADAVSRLDLLEGTYSAESLEELAQQHLAAGRAEVEVRALAQLASAIEDERELVTIQATQTPMETPSVSPSTPSPAPSPSPTPTILPPPTFRLGSMEKICQTDLTNPLIQVIVEDETGGGVAGVEVLIIWDSGEDHFFTGMKPELGLGYGDFRMETSVIYTLQLAGALETISDIQSEACALVEGGVFPGSVLLRFEEN